MSNQVILNEKQDLPAFGNQMNFEHSQRVAKMLSSSTLIPKEFQNNVQNTMIALEMSNRIGASPLMVMQNLYIVHGKPSWSSSFIIAAINATKKFTPLRFDVKGEGDSLSCIAWALENGTNERLESPKVTMQMAIAEGWVGKSGSKWKTMPELMIRYRAATFFGRLYAPEILMGMQTQDEIIDYVEVKSTINKTVEEKETDRLVQFITEANTIEKLNEAKDFVDGDENLTKLFNQKLQELNAN